jgi:hypothetical protein
LMVNPGRQLRNLRRSGARDIIQDWSGRRSPRALKSGPPLPNGHSLVRNFCLDQLREQRQ